jgi:hypothetical protein
MSWGGKQTWLHTIAARSAHAWRWEYWGCRRAVRKWCGWQNVRSFACPTHSVRRATDLANVRGERRWVTESTSQVRAETDTGVKTLQCTTERRLLHVHTLHEGGHLVRQVGVPLAQGQRRHGVVELRLSSNSAVNPTMTGKVEELSYWFCNLKRGVRMPAFGKLFDNQERPIAPERLAAPSEWSKRVQKPRPCSK